MKELIQYLQDRYQSESCPQVELSYDRLRKCAQGFVRIHPGYPCSSRTYQRFLDYINRRHRERFVERVADSAAYDRDLQAMLEELLTMSASAQAAAGQDFAIDVQRLHAIVTVAGRADPKSGRPMLRSASNQRIARTVREQHPEYNLNTLRIAVGRLRTIVTRMAQTHQIPDPVLVAARPQIDGQRGHLTLAIEQVDGLHPLALLVQPHVVASALGHFFRVLTWSGIPPRRVDGQTNPAWTRHVADRHVVFARRCDELLARDPDMTWAIREHLVAAFRLYCGIEMFCPSAEAYDKWVEDLREHLGHICYYLNLFEP